jgi:tight adherence protein B
MKGAPLARAVTAARALAMQRTGNQELGIITFDRTATVALPLTNDPNAISAALARVPSVGRGAYIYNALTAAVHQLSEARIAAGAVILLSDGASQGAKPQPGHNLTASSVGAAASAAHAQIYTVGLRDSSYTPQRMSLLARVGGGEFVESSSSQLAGIFTQIEARLTNRYVVHYRSLAPLGHRVDVTVTVDGVPQKGSLSYVSPPAPRAARPNRAAAKSFWASSLALVIFSCAAALVVGFGLFALVGPRLSQGRLRQAIGEFTTTHRPAGTGAIDSSDIGDAPLESGLSLIERLLARTRWWEGFKQDVAIARIKRRPVDLVAFTAVASAALALLLVLVAQATWLALLPLVLGPIALRSFVKYELHKQRELFADQLPSHLQELASAMRAGHSLVSGIATMAREAPEPSHSEWGQVVADEQLGVPLDEAMGPLAKRMGSEDVGQVALVASLHQRTGGNMAEVLERVADSVRERGELRRELRALTAQARMSRLVVTSLPLLVTAAVWALNPDYIRPLFQTATGELLLFIAAGLLVCAWRVMRMITDIKV